MVPWAWILDSFRSVKYGNSLNLAKRGSCGASVAMNPEHQGMELMSSRHAAISAWTWHAFQHSKIGCCTQSLWIFRGIVIERMPARRQRPTSKFISASSRELELFTSGVTVLHWLIHRSRLHMSLISLDLLRLVGDMLPRFLLGRE